MTIHNGTALERVLKARAELIQTRTFYGVLVGQVRPIISDRVPTMATDGKTHYVNAKFIDGLTQEEVLGTQAHESEHDARRHHTRRGWREHKEWNICCDLAINGDLIEQGFKLPKGALFDPRFKGMSAEDIYRTREIDRALKQKAEEEERERQRKEDEASEADATSSPDEDEADESDTDEADESEEGEAGDTVEDEASTSDEEDVGDQDGDPDQDTGEPGAGCDRKVPENEAGEAAGEAQDGSPDDGQGDPTGDENADGKGSEGAGEAIDEAPGEAQDGGENDGQGDPDDGGNAAGEAPGEAGGDADGPSSESCGDPGGCGEVLDAAPDSPAETANEDARWETILRQAAMLAAKRGTAPGHVAREVGNADHPPRDWRETLRAFFDQGATVQQSWNRPNRRFVGSGLYLPGNVRDGINKAVFLIDTSGSVTAYPGALEAIKAETQAALDEHIIDELVVIYGDTRVTRIDTFRQGDDLVFDPRGGGGTCMAPLFKYVRDELDDASLIVCFTDLYIEPESQLGPIPHCPVMWAVVGYPQQMKERLANTPWNAPGIPVEPIYN